MRIALVSDAWRPQINGVVRTLETTVAKLRARGHQVETVTPDLFRTIPCPSYPEIRLAIGSGGAVGRTLERFGAEAIHIATEGPLGWSARRWCISHGLPFSTSFHTRFPDYVALRTGLPSGWFWPIVRRFHAPAARIMVATSMLADELARHGLVQTHAWSRGVDLDLFMPGGRRLAAMASLPRPIQLYVGRVAVEKNIDKFLDAPVKGSKVVVGEGPARAHLQQRYPQAHFLGPLHGADLAAAYASADIFVFPSRTDTFGLVMIEALAMGTPIAAYPVQGPLEIIGGADCRIGAMNEDLAAAIAFALTANPADCVAHARRYSWDACTDQFVAGLCPIGHDTTRMAA
jgi:glycosyltransferase involved in cell wall biosynthesis